MSSDEDHGQGDEDRFPAEDLERLYHLGGIDIAQQILGSELNRILGTTRYSAKVWYLVTAKGVKRL